MKLSFKAQRRGARVIGQLFVDEEFQGVLVLEASAYKLIAVLVEGGARSYNVSLWTTGEKIELEGFDANFNETDGA